METMIGRVTHYYPRVGVAAVVLQDHLARGDRIHIRGAHDDIRQAVSSLELDHVPIDAAECGQDVGIRVLGRVHEGDVVYRE